MSGEKQTVVVNPPNGEPPASSSPPVERAIDQAEQFGAMRERFHSTEAAVLQMRSELEMDKDGRQTLNSRLSRLEEQQERLLTALEREREEEQETEADSSDSSTTVIVPPAIEVPKEEETPPKKKQSKLSLFLFGKDDE